MIIWGAIWGAIVGFFAGRHESWAGAIVGALLGALAGRTLRGAVRTEIEFQRAKWVAPPAAAPATTPVPAVKSVATPAPLTEAGPALAAATITPLAAPANLAHPAVQSTTAEPVHRFGETQSTQVTQPDLATRAVAAARNWLLGGNTIVRMGVVVLFVGLGFLAKYAIDNAFLPPELRLASIALAGIALFVLGFRLRSKHSDKLAYALTLQGAGVAVLYLTVFAAFRLYQFLPAGAAFVVLGLVCAFSTAIALLQNAMPMAFIGFAGAFAAPLLVSTGQGNHVNLFSYYLLLNLGVVGIAWLRAWRALNLLGFFATFGVATLWGVLKYRPEQLTSTEPFLIAFFLIYVLASLLYATRHSLAPKQAVDATLIFGTPLIAFGLQAGLVRDIEYATAFSALVTGGFYLGLGAWAMRRARQGSDVGRWLAECFVALGLGFVTLAVPLALDARWTSAVWAAEGAAVYWMGQRQGRWLARAVGLALQGFAALSYLSALDQTQVGNWPLANPAFIGAALLAFSALALAHWSRSAVALAATPVARQFGVLEQSLSPALFWIGFLWWQFALNQEIVRSALNDQGVMAAVFEPAMQAHLRMLAWLGSALVAHRLALAHRDRPWSIAATPAWFNLPVMLLIALHGMTQFSHVFQSWGWLAWPIALGLHGVMLRPLDAAAPKAWWSWTHSGGVWLLVLLGGNLLVWAVQQAQLHHTAWASVILLVAAIVVLLALSIRAWFDPASAARQRWPLSHFAEAYLWRAAVPVALLVALGCLAVAVHSDGNARPLPYVPLLNPTDLSVALGLGACALWLMRLRQGTLAIPMLARHPRLPLALVAIAFIAINTVWLRVAHQFVGVPWNAHSLYQSFLVQAGYSILWTLIALGLMIVAHRRRARPVWMGGAVLLGATVLKLFLIDLSNRGGSERIVVFIAVGVLMLVVGYFAPMPPPAATVSRKPQEVNP
ncbi:DUF2339 domain-containing protein [Rhodoferax sp.]|uniref:DUF2339 domain-containing protein n=1 Tax=Rhodoferax sp. TaxID=50421 RepID=UPI0027490075|nr:DUF2339 domain-containing protein [Rhodoferax sp.]